VLGSIINRLILSELVKVFLLSLTALTGLFLLVGLVQEAGSRGLSLLQVLAIIPLVVPNMLPYTIPATTLFATCVVYGRMAHDNEIVVLKAAGVNILTILKPAVLLGAVSAAVTLVLYYDVIPRTQRQLREQVLSDVEEVIYNTLRREGALRQPGLQYVMYVREVQGKRLLDVVFKKRVERGPGYEVVARAREARLRVDHDTKEVLIDMGRCTVTGEKDGVGADVSDRIYPIALPESMAGKDWRHRASALTWIELHERIGEAKNDLDKAQRLLEESRLRTPGPYATKEEADAHFNLMRARVFDVQHAQRFYYSLLAEVQMRPALAFGCLCFVLIGCPVGLWASRSDYLSIFVICFLPTLFVYYPLLLAGLNLARDGKVNPVIGVWTANLVLGLTSFYLIRKLMAR
jgi:lipopolysaccharide export system permease protein